MKRPTDKQIEAEIKRLKKIRPKIRQFTMFGDNNHQALDAQIRVLQERMSEDKIYDEFNDPDNPDSTSHVVFNARDAYTWLTGSEDSEGAPSEGWQPLVK